jgi:hypothetical protein
MNTATESSVIERDKKIVAIDKRIPIGSLAI